MHWQPLYPTITYVLVATAIVGVLVAARSMSVAPKNRWWLLLALRGALLFALLALLLNPIDRRETQLPPRPPSVTMLVDCSQSMALGIGRSRIDRVKSAIQAASSSLPAESATQVQLFRFGQRLTKVPSLAELNADDDASRLSEALDKLPSRIAAEQPRAVVLFSDGAVEDSPKLNEIVESYRDLDIPVHTYLPDVDDLRGDVAITHLAIPTRVADGDKATVRTVVESRGFAGQRVVLTVRPADRPNATPLASLPITLRDGATPAELVVTVDGSMGELALQVPLSRGEAVDSNNAIRFRLGDRDNKLNVLYMEGTAGSEYRWIRDGLQEDPQIRCVSMVLNNQYAQRPSLQRVDDRYRGFPATRSELFKYDVVICSDIPRGAFTPEQIAWTVDLVSKRGGGFAMVGGHTSFGSGGWDRTPWEQLIPFDMTGRRDYLTQSFRVDVPSAAESHPIWKLLDDPVKNRQALDSMPQFLGTNLISRVKPAATLLGQSKSSLSRVGVMPVFASETFGRGRTFAMASDSTAYWGRYFESQWGEGDNRYFRKFWRNVVRWLAENSQASERRLIVRSDKVIYSVDEVIQIRAEAFDEQLETTTGYRLTAEVTSPDADLQPDVKETTSVELDVLPDLDQYVAEIPAMLPKAMFDSSQPMQAIQVVVKAWDGEEVVATNALDLQLIQDSNEWLNPQSKPALLRKVADSGGGKLISDQNQLSQLLSSFDSAPGEVLVHTLPLWDHPLLWTALLGMLAIDWTVRRIGFRNRKP